MTRDVPVLGPPGQFGEMDLICFSHLRWGFVFQRPQHLMSRFAKYRRVFYIEEPVFDSVQPDIQVRICPRSGVTVVVPRLPPASRDTDELSCLQTLLDGFIRSHKINRYIAWFYTPMALAFAADLRPVFIVYDCMDELSMFRGAPPALVEYEAALLRRADVVFTGGLSLFEAKCERHRNVHAFPSSVEVAHFGKARRLSEEPEDQRAIPHPRIGFAGVIDERMDLELLRGIADVRPDWQIVMLGPVVKIRDESLPKNPNIHYLGMKTYDSLPAYFCGWDIGTLPFALNDSTRFISPTKTPEYLAAGLPVVSTPIRDVIRPYGDLGLVRIASGLEDFVRAIDETLTFDSSSIRWRERVDGFLSTLSWDYTWHGMNALIRQGIESSTNASSKIAVDPSRARSPEAIHV